ncbi:MAG: hypothetical protein H8D23_20915 [Candidatus Brocadiales bacterium]|nr:hypothetical protein [Candidatus Brocadiales bacterium]
MRRKNDPKHLETYRKFAKRVKNDWEIKPSDLLIETEKEEEYERLDDSKHGTDRNSSKDSCNT